MIWHTRNYEQTSVFFAPCFGGKRKNPHSPSTAGTMKGKNLAHRPPLTTALTLGWGGALILRWGAMVTNDWGINVYGFSEIAESFICSWFKNGRLGRETTRTWNQTEVWPIIYCKKKRNTKFDIDFQNNHLIYFHHMEVQSVIDHDMRNYYFEYRKSSQSRRSKSSTSYKIGRKNVIKSLIFFLKSLKMIMLMYVSSL